MNHRDEAYLSGKSRALPAEGMRPEILVPENGTKSDIYYLSEHLSAQKASNATFNINGKDLRLVPAAHPVYKPTARVDLTLDRALAQESSASFTNTSSMDFKMAFFKSGETNTVYTVTVPKNSNFVTVFFPAGIDRLSIFAEQVATPGSIELGSPVIREGGPDALKLNTQELSFYLDMLFATGRNDEASALLRQIMSRDPAEVGYILNRVPDKKVVADIMEEIIRSGNVPFLETVLGNKTSAPSDNVREACADLLENRPEICGDIRSLVLLAVSLTRVSNRSPLPQGHLLKNASERLRNDKEVVTAAVKNEPAAMEFASETLKNDKDYLSELLDVLDRFSIADCFKMFSEGVRGDKRTVLNVILKDGKCLKYASASMQDDMDVVKAAVSTNSNNIWYASERIRNEPEVMFDLIDRQTGLIDASGPRVKGLIDHVFSDVLGIRLYERFRSSWKEIVRNRYSVCVDADKRSYLERVLGNEFFKGLDNDPRPLAYASLAWHDHNGAFKNGGDDIVDLIKGYKVVYYELTSDSDLEKSIKEVKSSGRPELMFVGAHGTKTSMLFDPGKGIGGRLDVNDYFLRSCMKDFIKDGGMLITRACDVGSYAGEDRPKYIDNLIEFLHYITDFKVHVFGSQEPSYGMSFVMKENKVVDVIYSPNDVLHLYPGDKRDYNIPHDRPFEDAPVSAALSVDISPNPFRDGASISVSRNDDGRSARILITDLLGRRIREYEASSTSVIKWDGKDSNGVDVPSGSYLVNIVEPDGKSITRKAVKTR